MQTTKLSHEQLLILSDIEKMIANKKIPDSYPDFMTQRADVQLYISRDTLTENIGFVLLSENWLKDLSRWIGKRHCLEVMSGLGALSYGLKKQGVNIIATDDYSWKEESSPIWNNKELWTCVERLDAVQSVEKYGKNVDLIIMSWPPYDKEVAVNVLNKMREVNPYCMMIYIGEDDGGCTANDEFFTTFEIIEDESFDLANAKFQSWPLIHDQPLLIK